MKNKIVPASQKTTLTNLENIKMNFKETSFQNEKKNTKIFYTRKIKFGEDF